LNLGQRRTEGSRAPGRGETNTETAPVWELTSG